ncbi:MAG: Rrf2 family transcriptional regulator [Flexilinea sp.]|jgi:Rrf2 family protein
MKVSTKGRYALRFMLDLALHNSGEYVSLKDISVRQEISIKYLEQIVTILGHAGYVKSVRGPQGGYKLAYDPNQYTAGSILRLTEGSLAPVACLDDNPNQCNRAMYCETIELWEKLYKAINDVVDHVTLADLAEEQKRKSGMDYVI